MADLTQEVELTGTWLDITTDQSLGSGQTYGVDVSGVDVGAIVLWAVTDTSTPEPTVRGHPITLRQDIPVDYREVGQVSGQFLWMRVNRGTATLVITQA